MASIPIHADISGITYTGHLPLALSAPKALPEFPKHHTQAARLLSALLKFRRIDPLHGWRIFGIYRLADVVFQLRGLGWAVITGRLNVTNRFDETCHVAEYRLSAESIESAGNAGQRFADDEIALMSERRAA